MQVGKLFWKGRWENYFGRAGGKIILTGGEIILAEVEKLFWQVEKLICCWLVVLVLPQRSLLTLCLVVGDPVSSEIQ